MEQVNEGEISGSRQPIHLCSHRGYQAGDAIRSTLHLDQVRSSEARYRKSTRGL